MAVRFHLVTLLFFRFFLFVLTLFGRLGLVLLGLLHFILLARRFGFFLLRFIFLLFFVLGIECRRSRDQG